MDTSSKWVQTHPHQKVEVRGPERGRIGPALMPLFQHYPVGFSIRADTRFSPPPPSCWTLFAPKPPSPNTKVGLGSGAISLFSPPLPVDHQAAATAVPAQGSWHLQRATRGRDVCGVSMPLPASQQSPGCLAPSNATKTNGNQCKPMGTNGKS